MTVTDPDGRLASGDYLDAVQELRDAGAEAISVDGERVVATTAIVDTPDGIAVGDTVLSSPVEIRAIGDPDTLAAGPVLPRRRPRERPRDRRGGHRRRARRRRHRGDRVSARTAPGLGSLRLDSTTQHGARSWARQP